ncbi:vasoactive intestinal polypeptide receptor-like [Narcine bancroftii]|uniref:vasoactive intestinal polypeptide receptor-like n=1 Tax=Narcine bancroftii TaxID=1343680 RepID=UPI0038321B1D
MAPWPLLRAGVSRSGPSRCALVYALLVPLLTQVLAAPQECDALEKIARLHEECLWMLDRGDLSPEAGCKWMWDNLTCWPPASVGERVVMPCPQLPGLFLDTAANISRNCTITGWTQLSVHYFLACGYNKSGAPSVEEAQFYRALKAGYTFGHSLSLLSLTVAMIILCIFSKLHCTRNYIHMHLFMSFILRAIAVFIKDLVLFEAGESDHCSIASAGCKVAMVFFQYSIMANFFWLLVEGLYLHTLLVISFFSEKKYFWWYIFIGWGTPLLLIFSWIITRVHLDDDGCWQNIDSPLWWIIRAPIVISILVNFILFVCIIRILIQKLHSTDIGLNESSQYS